MTEEGRVYGEQVVIPIYHAEQRSIHKLPEAGGNICLDVLAQYVSILKGELSD